MPVIQLTTPPKWWYRASPTRPTLRTSPPYFPPSRLPVFCWLLCEPLLIDGCIRPWCISCIFIFCHSIWRPKRWNGVPHALSRPRASALTSPLSLLPILGWLLYAIIKRRPPKSRALPISLFFYVSLFGAPNRQTSHRAAKPDHDGHLAWDLSFGRGARSTTLGSIFNSKVLL